MVVLKRRSRLVSFRVSEDEYQKLYNVCLAVGARSVSDVARQAVGRLVGFNGEFGEDLLAQQMRNLDRVVDQLKSKVDQLSRELGEQEQPRQTAR
jgi:hypothetical protein